MAEMDVTARFRADITDIKSKMDQISRGLGDLDGSSNRANKGMGALGKGVAVAGLAFGAATAGVAVLGAGLMKLAQAGQESAAVSRTTEQIIKTTGAAAGVTATQVNELADALSRKTGIDDEAIQTGANLILTFKNVKNAGEGTDAIFNRATAAALDLSKAGFGSVDSASKSLGKALNDPIKGITALSRAGVTFTQGQKDQIAALMESGKTLEAQKIILAEVESQVGGVAEAAKSPIEAIQTMLGNLIEDVGKTILPVFNQIADALGPVLEKLGPPLASIAEMLGGVLVTALQALTPLFDPIAEAVGALAAMLGPVLTGIIQALVPVITPLIEIVGQLANILGPVLSAILTAIMPLIQGLGSVIAALAPAFLGIFQALAPVVEMLAGVLGQAIAMIVPLIVKLAQILGGILTKALQMLGPYWEALADIVGKVLGAILPPLIDVLMTLLDALTPILDPLMEIAGLFIEMATPILELVGVLAPLIALGIKLIAAVLKPLIEVIGKVVGAFIKWIADGIKPLQPQFKEGMKVITQFAATAVRAAAEVVRNFGKMVTFLMNNVFRKILDGAVETFGWIPGIGDALQTAQSNFANFANSTVENINGVAAELDGVATQLDTMAQGYTVPVSVQVTTTYDESSKMWMKEGAKPPAPKPPKPTPYTAPTPTGTGAADKAAEEKEKKRIEAIEKFVDRYKSALERMKQGRDAILGSVQKSPWAEMLGDLEQSQIESTFGPGGSVSQVISSYDQLGAALEDFYKPLMDAELFGKKAAKAAKSNLATAKTMLSDATATALSLMKQRELNVKALSDLDKSYSDGVESINRTYDALDKAASDALSAVEKKWAGITPGLEAALDSATKAFEKENSVLEKLISERDNFLGRIADGFRTFLNDIRVDAEAGGGSFRAALEDRLTSIREFATNIRTLISRGLDPTLVQDFVASGVSGAGDIAAQLAAASDTEIAGINDAQKALATEVASFQQYASQQWFDAGIAQQEAIVAPLALARDLAKTALDTANATRAAEIAAAQAHIETLKVQRQAALDAAKAQYDSQKAALIAQGVEIENALTTNATNLHNGLAALQETVPPEMFKAGKKSVRQILKGFEDKFPGVKKELNSLMDGLAASMNRTATVTVRTVYEAGGLPARAMGGPVAARTAYLVGERGPEVFVPGMAGNVIANKDLGSLMRRPMGVADTGVTIAEGAVQITVNGSMDSKSRDEIEAVVDEALLRLAREIRRS